MTYFPSAAKESRAFPIIDEKSAKAAMSWLLSDANKELRKQWPAAAQQVICRCAQFGVYPPEGL